MVVSAASKKAHSTAQRGPMPAHRDKVLAAYDPGGTGDKGEVGVGLASDGAMVEPARLMARLASAARMPTWHYRFSYVASSLRKEVKGALHATEIPFVFETVKAKYGEAATAEDLALAAAANAYWVAFARSGDPNGEGRPRWPLYSTQSDEILDFVTAGGVDDVEMWAWVAAYDHVALCQLWGPMTALPRVMPRFTRELKQYWQEHGSPALPDVPDDAHDALADARHNLAKFRAVEAARAAAG